MTSSQNAGKRPAFCQQMWFINAATFVPFSKFANWPFTGMQVRNCLDCRIYLWKGPRAAQSRYPWVWIPGNPSTCQPSLPCSPWLPHSLWGTWWEGQPHHDGQGWGHSWDWCSSATYRSWTVSSLRGELFSILAGDRREKIGVREFTVVRAHPISPQKQVSLGQVLQTSGGIWQRPAQSSRLTPALNTITLMTSTIRTWREELQDKNDHWDK